MPTSRKPSREAVLSLLASEPKALHAREIAARLSIREADYLDLLALLGDLAFSGAARGLPGQRYRAATSTGTREGFLHVHPRGFAFLSSAGLTDDVFLPAQALGGAMHGDRVRVKVLAGSRRALEGIVSEVLERANHRIQGVLRKRGRSAWLEVEDARVRGPVILPREVGGEDGDAAVVEVTRFPESVDENPEGRLLKCFGPPGDPAVETEKVLLREEVHEEFSEQIEHEALAARSAEQLLSSRVDLRSLPLVTIDPDDARDHDDAIWVGETENGYEVCVAIADVAEHVQEGSALDQEAQQRAFSIYLPDRAIPMLPAALSSEACSLLEGQERLCIAVRMLLDAGGRVQSANVVEGVLRSRGRLSYSGVARSLRWTDNPDFEDKIDKDLLVHLDRADRLARLLRKRRLRRGSLDLNVPEARIVLDAENRDPIAVQRRAQDPGVRRAYQLIEELMLLANETVAKWLKQQGLQPVYRVHPPPDEAKLERLARLCDTLGIEFSAEDAADPQRLSHFLARCSELPLSEIIGMLTLRSLKQASYDLVNVGHFGLALVDYLHFTSPIRRYPDLLVHRLIKRALRKDEQQAVIDPEWLRQSVDHCNKRERKILEIEREIADLYRAIFMRSKIGLIAEGRVFEVLPTSVIVTLDDPFVDVRVSEDMLGNDSYEMSEDGLALVARRSGDRVCLGDRMTVRVEDVSLARRSVTGRRVSVEIGRKRGRKGPATRPGKNETSRRNHPKNKRKAGSVRTRRS